MEIMVIGAETKNALQEAVTRRALEITVTEVSLQQAEGLLNKGVEQAVIVNGKGRIIGRVPTSQEIADLLNELSWRQNAGVIPRSFFSGQGGGGCCCG